MADYGAQDMIETLARVLMRRPARRAAKTVDQAVSAEPDPDRAVAQYERLAGLVAGSGAEILWLDDRDDALTDAHHAADISLVTAAGAVLLYPSKPGRKKEIALHEAAYRRAGVPILGRIEAPGTLEGSDCLWLDARTLLVGRGFGTNEEGVVQLAELLGPQDIDVLSYDLPYWKGEAASLTLLSLISPVSRDTALVYLPLLPAALYQFLEEWGVAMVEAPEDEFVESQGLSLQVLALSPKRVIAVEGYPKTRAVLEEAGCTVSTFSGDALCAPGPGGPPRLVRPVLREGL
ncbi:dimethylarginine dimethylaminohydrolase family protein [Rhizobium sp. YIM 134829]|uniref:dimethylarginine dimethylaminohydrolase family protein n=1 Tax=Rhizobium sp. YIM 134829 TaxID=3390453 RepID=UPI00397C93C8